MKKLTKEEKIARKKYLKNIRKTKKELINQAKRYGPWDENFLFEYMGIIFQSWIDYYSQSYNVWAEDDCKWNPYAKDVPTRLEIAKELKRLYDEFYGYYGFDGNELREKEKALYDYMLKYIHYMWD